jgi:hypothetical protein
MLVALKAEASPPVVITNQFVIAGNASEKMFWLTKELLHFLVILSDTCTFLQQHCRVRTLFTRPIAPTDHP